MFKYLRTLHFKLLYKFRSRKAEKARRFDLIQDVMEKFCEDWIYKHGNSCAFPCPFWAVCSHLSELNSFGRKCRITKENFIKSINNNVIDAIDEYDLKITFDEEYDCKI